MIALTQPSCHNRLKSINSFSVSLLDSEMIDLLSRADRNLGRLDGMTLTLPNPDMFVFMYVRKEAVERNGFAVGGGGIA